METFTSPPASWAEQDVITWAEQSKLGPAVVTALAQNKVDGPTLVTLTKEELKLELNISSLPARRYLWELIKGLQSEQETTDYSKAIELHEQEIQDLVSSERASMKAVGGPDMASGGSTDTTSDLSLAVNELANDAQRQRQLLEDHMAAHRMQRAMNLGLQVYEDAEAARREQVRLNELMTQEESDRQFAESLATGRKRRSVDARRRQEQHAGTPNTATILTRDEDQKRFSSLFGLAIQACSDNKLDVAEAFRTGKIKPIAIAETAATESINSNDSKPAVIPKTSSGLIFEEEEDLYENSARNAVERLPCLDHCNVCYGEYQKGYRLACDHQQCISCTRSLFKTALGDASLLPLRCCEIPIDMNIAKDLLPRDEATTIFQRVEELGAKNKMYCLSCNAFINLDLVDTTFATDLLCGCGIALCMVCKTSAHPGATCSENQSFDSRGEEAVLQLSREQGWKQCPGCSTIIELRSGCNHMTCSSCRHEFCYNCLQPWSSRNAQCSTGRCELWDEDRLLEAGENRVQQEEVARGRALPRAERRERLQQAMAGLRANEICDHDWDRVGGYHGDCPNCDFEMNYYAMRCQADCGSTVC